MRCCVPDCKNDSRHMSKSEGITFHVFPTEQTLRRAWLRALGRETWKPKEQSAVCSQHFLTEDLYETKSGLRKVKSGAMPHVVVNQDSSNFDFGKQANVKACRICLVMDSKLFPMKKYKLEPVYEQLTGLSLAAWSRLPAHLCMECSTRALNLAQFRTKSLRAHTILTEILHKHDQLTAQNIKSIDREANQLTTNLSTHKIPDLNTIQLTHEEKDNIKDTELKSTEPPSLHEVNISIDEVQVKTEEEQNSFFEENNYAESLKEEDDVNDEKHDNALDDDDFVASDHNSSSSCDSLPINQLKRAKRKVEKTKKKKKETKPKEIKKVRKKAVKKDPSEPKIDRRRKPFLNEDLNETLFTITDLSFEEQIAEIEKRQESANYKNSVYKCTSCYKGFLDEEAYESHVVRHTDACGEHACKICKTHFKQPHALRKHITAHHTHRFSCNHCAYVTTHRQTARLHERWHKGTKYQCPHCQDEFVKFTTYMGHIRIKHPSQFVCELCGYSFVSAKGIELHKKLKHRLENIPIPEDGPYCETCNVKFVSEEAHRRHLQVSGRHAEDSKGPREANKPKKSRKPREPKVQRDRSPKQKRDSSERRLYPSQMRRAEGPIPCEQCGLQLEDSRAYHGHFRRMHPDKNRTNYPSMKSPCMCEVCGRMFQSYALLKDHTWTHTGEKPFKCELCSKSFRMKQRLVAHRRVHSQQRATYVCGVCGKHFSTHSNRQRHMFIHTGLKPFKCEMCGKGFKHASEKRAHVTYVHLKKPWPKRARSKRGKEHGYDRQDQTETEDVPREGVREMEIAPLWPCDPKMPDMSHMLEDKPQYYNLKI